MMSGLEKQRLENQIRDMSEEDVKWLCTLIADVPLANELGMRLVRFRKNAAEAKQALSKVV